ncbi:MAG: hypothetical protein AAGJ94_00765 [Pseudomonadota bacterium]
MLQTSKPLIHNLFSGAQEVFDPASDLIVFLHIEKTAGSTLSKYLRRALGDDRYRWFPEEKLLQAAGSGALSGLWMVAGHIPFGFHHLIGRRCLYVTMLRDPIDRIESWYYYQRTRPERGGYAMAHKLDINDWAERLIERGSPVVSNFQTRRVLGYRLPEGERAFEIVRAHVERSVSFIAPSDQVDRFAGWVCATVGCPFEGTLERKKVNAARPATSGLDPATRAKLVTLNALDLDLVRWVDGLHSPADAGE